MKQTLSFLVILLSTISLAQTVTPNNCNVAIAGCTSPSFTIAPNNSSTNIVDFTAGSISDPSTNPNPSPGNAGCLLTGETSSTFITINVISSGTLAWSIIGTAGGCFDWIMWPMVTQASVCAGINGNTLPPIACNWNGACNGNTGMAPAGSLPLGGNASCYENPLVVTAGQQFMLCLSNYSGTQQNVGLNFFGTAGVACGVAAPNKTICQGNSTSVTISTPGLINPQFQWLVTTGVSNITGGTNVQVSPTLTTVYRVKVTEPPVGNLPAFIDTATFTVFVVPPPIPNAGIDDTVCLGQVIHLSGTVSSTTNTPSWQSLTTGISPTPVISFSPNFNTLTPNITVNQPGLYKFILRENNSVCGMGRDTVKILVYQHTHTTNSISPSCFGGNNGVITIDSPQAVQYSFDNGVTWQADSFAIGYAAGTYSVCSRNITGCQKCSNAIVTNPPKMQVILSNDTLICQNGTANLSASVPSVSSALTYNWSHTASTLAQQVVHPTANTTYYVFAQSANGCISGTDSIVVTIRPPISGTITPNDTICPGYPKTITASASGGIGAPYTFNWNTGAEGVGSTHTISSQALFTANYTVTIKDVCESSPLILTSNVAVAPLPLITISADTTQQCEPAIFHLTNTTNPLLVGSSTWYLPNGQFISNQQSVDTKPLFDGTYNIRLIVTTPKGCIDSMTFLSFLTVHPKPVAQFKYNPNPVFMLNTTVKLENYSIGGDSYQWTIPSGNPAYSQEKNVTTHFPDGVISSYDVMLITTSEFNCTDTAEQKIIILPETIIYSPNSFTPNEDERNQSWRVYINGIDHSDFKLLIFNRWGELIWESFDPEASWDGTYNGKIVEQGTYTWFLRTKDAINDGKYEFNGFINVLK